MNTQELFDKVHEELKDLNKEDIQFPILFSVGVPNLNPVDKRNQYKTGMLGSEKMLKDMLTNISSEPIMRNAVIGAAIDIIAEKEPILALAIAANVKLMPTSDSDGTPCDCEECTRRRKANTSPGAN